MWPLQTTGQALKPLQLSVWMGLSLCSLMSTLVPPTWRGSRVLVHPSVARLQEWRAEVLQWLAFDEQFRIGPRRLLLDETLTLNVWLLSAMNLALQRWTCLVLCRHPLLRELCPAIATEVDAGVEMLTVLPFWELLTIGVAHGLDIIEGTPCLVRTPSREQKVGVGRRSPKRKTPISNATESGHSLTSCCLSKQSLTKVFANSCNKPANLPARLNRMVCCSACMLALCLQPRSI